MLAGQLIDLQDVVFNLLLVALIVIRMRKTSTTYYCHVFLHFSQEIWFSLLQRVGVHHLCPQMEDICSEE